MKILFYIALLILLFPSFCYSDAFIPKENQIILGNYGCKTWNPTKKETQRALTAIYGFLNDPEKFLTNINVLTTDTEYLKGEIKKIYKNIRQYKVQFVGVNSNGNKVILCNFFPKKNSFTDWKENFIMVKDGGFWFWQVEYDPKSNKIIKFTSNGYA